MSLAEDPVPSLNEIGDIWHHLGAMGEAVAIEWYMNTVANTLPSDYRLAIDKNDAVDDVDMAKIRVTLHTPNMKCFALPPFIAQRLPILRWRCRLWQLTLHASIPSISLTFSASTRQIIGSAHAKEQIG